MSFRSVADIFHPCGCVRISSFCAHGLESMFHAYRSATKIMIIMRVCTPRAFTFALPSRGFWGKIMKIESHKWKDMTWKEIKTCLFFSSKCSTPRLCSKDRRRLQVTQSHWLRGRELGKRDAAEDEKSLGLELGFENWALPTANTDCKRGNGQMGSLAEARCGPR